MVMDKVGKTVSTFTQTRRFSTAFTKAWSLRASWVRCIYSTHYCLLDFSFNIIPLFMPRSPEKLNFCDSYLKASTESSFNFRELRCNEFHLQNATINSSSTFWGNGTFSRHVTSRMTSVKDVIYSWLDNLVTTKFDTFNLQVIGK